MSLKSLTYSELAKIVNHRTGEIKLGEQVLTLDSSDLSELDAIKAKGVKFCLLGIPESIGVIGNGGKTGTENAWWTFLNAFLNIQSNRFLSGEAFVVLGEVDVRKLQVDLDQTDTNEARLLCERVDEMVYPIITAIVKSGLIPIVIGGGHNNAYPLLKGVAMGLNLNDGMNAINLDAHADFRSLEGRHSGNGFSYAKQHGFLNNYSAFGLHQSYNSESLLKSMDETGGVDYTFLEDIEDFEASLNETIASYKNQGSWGVEVDMDAIKMIPSSAISPSGVTLEQARFFVRKCAENLMVKYLHLPEAAPTNSLEERMVGKALSYLVADFAKAYLQKKKVS
ncbi:formimidoylglutamase [Roseivirga misakiensis]|uniref:Arginase n=1 Tax=Roseivirga misakiensis TaxID=1563681 RepID=A0A1E5SYX5_9BACT|nr:formimidoylglutamase [Roseivirga misakiensis]OEK04333.1 hypothetical protein BFP71_12685 [Roseivirga misakiensis]